MNVDVDRRQSLHVHGVGATVTESRLVRLVAIETLDLRPLSARPIALAGFMGAGKTSVGRLLAQWLGRRFIDTDDEAERLAGRSILDCFGSGEEAVFREYEAQAVRVALGQAGVVIALGGGAMLREDTRRRLRDSAVLVHLHLPWDQVRARLPELIAARPLLQGRTEAEVERLYRARLSLYSQAHVQVQVPPTGVEAAARQVLKTLNNGGWSSVTAVRRNEL